MAPEAPTAPSPPRRLRSWKDGWAAAGLALALVAVLVAVVGAIVVVRLLTSEGDCDDVSCGEGTMYAAFGLAFIVPPTALVLSGLGFTLCLGGLWRGSKRGAGRTVAWVGIAVSATTLVPLGALVAIYLGLPIV